MMPWNFEIVGSVGIGMAAFFACVGAKSLLPRLRRARLSPTKDAPSRSGKESLQSIQSGLSEIYQQLDSPAADQTLSQKVSSIQSLYRCGISSSEIAQHLHMSRGEVELAILADRHRVERVFQKMAVLET
jgi:DNA-binding NarL/FixJ family response regulator